jgi:hypothetical protein
LAVSFLKESVEVVDFLVVMVMTLILQLILAVDVMVLAKI